MRLSLVSVALLAFATVEAHPYCPGGFCVDASVSRARHPRQRANPGRPRGGTTPSASVVTVTVTGSACGAPTAVTPTPSTTDEPSASPTASPSPSPPTSSVSPSSLAPSPSAPSPSGTPGANCKAFVVPGRSDGFTKRTFVDFSGPKASSQSASQFLSANGIEISNWPVGSTHEFVTQNVILGSDSLQLKVNANNGGGRTVGAEIATKEEFKYASVRTVQKSSKTAGVCEGNFLYKSDSQETDWEILTSTIDKSSACVPKGIWATNQALTPGTKATSNVVPFTFDPREDFHEYRIDWTPEATTFYIDGKQLSKITTNVPTAAGPWMWNAWSNGDPCWSAGPPTADSITEIRSIEIYKGYTQTVAATGADVCNI